MIITVTLNAAIDKTLAVPNFQVGRRHRSTEQRTMPGGKGVNVARALKTLGQPVIATGLAGGRTGTRIIEQLTEEAILCDFVRINDESRTSTAVIDPTSGVQTEINELGPEVTEAGDGAVPDKLLYLAKGADICVFAGSLPRGVRRKLYAELIGELKRLGVMTVSTPRASRWTWRCGPGPTWCRRTPARPRQLVGHEFRDEQDQVYALYKICDLGPREAIITARGGLLRAARPRPRARPVRAFAPTASSRCRRSAPATPSWPATSPPATTGRPHGDALRFAVACGAESTQHMGAGVLDPRAAERHRARGRGDRARRARARRRARLSRRLPRNLGVFRGRRPVAERADRRSRWYHRTPVGRRHIPVVVLARI